MGLNERSAEVFFSAVYHHGFMPAFTCSYCILSRARVWSSTSTSTRFHFLYNYAFPVFILRVFKEGVVVFFFFFLFYEEVPADGEDPSSCEAVPEKEKGKELFFPVVEEPNYRDMAREEWYPPGMTPPPPPTPPPPEYSRWGVDSTCASFQCGVVFQCFNVDSCRVLIQFINHTPLSAVYDDVCNVLRRYDWGDGHVAT